MLTSQRTAATPAQIKQVEELLAKAPSLYLQKANGGDYMVRRCDTKPQCRSNPDALVQMVRTKWTEAAPLPYAEAPAIHALIGWARACARDRCSYRDALQADCASALRTAASHHAGVAHKATAGQFMCLSQVHDLAGRLVLANAK